MWDWGDPPKKEPKVTHTLHRRGDVESLHEDYVLLFMPAKGINFDESEERMKQIWEVISHYKENLVNFGNSYLYVEELENCILILNKKVNIFY